jgi:hypothetical protein
LVHDSDFLCYWLFENGKVVDEFNSCPDYFEDNGLGNSHAATLRGRPEVLLRFCQPGSRLRDVQKILESDSAFAEDQLQRLAQLLGLDEGRALTDYRDLDETSAEEFQAEYIGDSQPQARKASSDPSNIKFPGAEAFRAVDAESDDNDEATRGGPPSLFTKQIAQMMGFGGATQPSDPLVTELVQAAADGKISEIERLISAGADPQGEAPMKLSPQGQSSLSARMLSGGGIAFPVTPLLAAIVNKHVDAARFLIELGADVHAQHRLFGTPLHGAVSASSPELVQLLVDAGADVNAPNKQGQTPIQVLQAMRIMIGQLDSLRALGGQLFNQVESELKRLTDTDGWNECERILRARGGH